MKPLVLSLSLLAVIPATSHAQAAGSVLVSAGWMHFAPQSSSGPLTLTSVGGVSVNTGVPNTSIKAGSSDTFGLSATYFVTDHVAPELVFGIPSTFDLEGRGALASYGKLGSAKQWSPALLLKYYFRDPQARLRPYAGIGVTRIWFTGASVTNAAFEQKVLGGPTTVSTDRSWAPVLNLGVNYAVTEHWFAGFSLSYIPVSVTARLNTVVRSPVGTIPVQSQTKIRLNPIVAFVNASYRFR
ncbi:OmpW family protein [Burkholderia reimsis]|uniref:OmpW family protein n=1 Tax=Burkholderia reimsis TaxID=2234132 RepID=A0A365QHX0_9BURK|nr:OmpW family outer membrane protein [Burkholderia reimsis]RBB31875.1 OmpW family protein [Burkholderia reimsis]